MPLCFVTTSLATAFILITDLRIHCPPTADPAIVDSKMDFLTREKSKIRLIVFRRMVEFRWTFRFEICRRWSRQARFAMLAKLPSPTARKSSRYKFKITRSLFARELSNTGRVVLSLFLIFISSLFSVDVLGPFPPRVETWKNGSTELMGYAAFRWVKINVFPSRFYYGRDVVASFVTRVTSLLLFFFLFRFFVQSKNDVDSTEENHSTTLFSPPFFFKFTARFIAIFHPFQSQSETELFRRFCVHRFCEIYMRRLNVGQWNRV